MVECCEAVECYEVVVERCEVVVECCGTCICLFLLSSCLIS